MFVKERMNQCEFTLKYNTAMKNKIPTHLTVLDES